MFKMTKMTEIEKMAEKFNNDLEAVAKELKRVQSLKCRLKKQKGKKTYEEEMTEVVKYEQVLKEVRQLLDPKEKPVTINILEENIGESFVTFNLVIISRI